MIPASYLFKNYYQRHWLDAGSDATPTTERKRRFTDGPTRPIAGLTAARPTGRVAGRGRPAYE